MDGGGGHPVLDEREVQGMLHEVLLFVQHNSTLFVLTMLSLFYS